MDYIGYAYNNANQRTEQWRGAATTNTAVSTNYANYTNKCQFSLFKLCPPYEHHPFQQHQ